MNCEKKGCNKKSWGHGYIEEIDSMYLVFVCKEHFIELAKIQKEREFKE